MSQTETSQIDVTPTDDYYAFLRRRFEQDWTSGLNLRERNLPFCPELEQLDEFERLVVCDVAVASTFMLGRGPLRDSGPAELLARAASIFHLVRTIPPEPQDILLTSLRRKLPDLTAAAAEGTGATELPPEQQTEVLLTGVLGALMYMQVEFAVTFRQALNEEPS